MINLMVVFGGQSCEHDISVITGVQLINNCNKNIYNVIPIYINKDGRWFTGEKLKDIDNYPSRINKLRECCLLPNSQYLYIKTGSKFKRFCKVDCSILCLHGMRGEDGVVAGIMEMSQIPYSASSICCSSVCMDKIVFKYLMMGLGVPVVEGVGFSKEGFEKEEFDLMGKINKLNLPVIIKPSRQGSSVGISICKDYEVLANGINKAFLYDESVLVEKFLKIKKEVNIALFKYKGDLMFSNSEEPIKYGDFLSFDEKYRKSGGNFEKIKRVIPADITDEQLDKIKEISTKVYEFLNAVGIIRFDFLIDEDDNIFLNEVNTIPGSMANYLYKDICKYDELIDMIVKNSIYIKRSSDIKTIDSGILEEGIGGIKK